MSETETAKPETTTPLFDEVQASAIAGSFGLDASDKEAVQALAKALNHAEFTPEEAAKLSQESASGTLSDESKQLLGSKIQFEQGLTPAEKEKLMQWMTKTGGAETKPEETAKPVGEDPPITIDAKDAKPEALDLAAKQEELQGRIKEQLEATVRPAATQFQQLGEQAEGLQKEQAKLVEEARSAMKKTATISIIATLAAGIAGYIGISKSGRGTKWSKVLVTAGAAIVGALVSSVASLKILAKPLEQKMRAVNEQQQIVDGGMQQAQGVMNAGIQEVTAQFKPEIDALQQMATATHVSRVARKPSVSEIAANPPAESLAERVKASQAEAAGAARA